MLTLVRSIVSVVACRVRSRVDLELEVLALRHQPYTRPGGGDSNSKPWSDVRRNQIPRVSLANEGYRRAPKKSRIQGEQILSSTDAFIRAE